MVHSWKIGPCMQSKENFLAHISCKACFFLYYVVLFASREVLSHPNDAVATVMVMVHCDRVSPIF